MEPILVGDLTLITDVFKIDGEIKNKLDSLFLDIPNAYKFDFYIKINDYEGYDIQDAVEAFKHSVEFTLLRKKKSNKNKRTLSIILLLLGVITLAIMFILNNYSYNFIL